ncbi:hypothetical protein GB931_13860 [Modestobacter sp. I12A-02628]|uniref:SPW repeat-containing integral membrane domain-containing protein n=1 Tax=Goekera deserti TaxID=2497753 RepID=A0A7K3WHK4_9ACTN|nr:hypothetical protein [Goekera deserti]MPQ98988.1 hypothetical protein [Goekera deserti]NDI47322.1 hypothetical protein [Goekera deserti]NEL55852.1 hypothetical protein [Goekera deserti]
MLREGPIPQAVHGLLEYLVGALFVAAPFLFAFTDEGMATAASIVLGIAFLVVAATSAGPTGLVKQLPPVVQALLDVILAGLLVAAPFVLGFSGVATPRNLFLVSGVLWLLITIASRYGHREPPATDTATVTGGSPADPFGTATQQPPGDPPIR